MTGKKVSKQSEKVQENNGDIVKMRNTLARTKMPFFNTLEAKIFALSVSQLRTDDKEIGMCKININNFINKESKGGKNYRLLDEATNNLMNTIQIKRGNDFEKFVLYSYMKKEGDYLYVQLNMAFKDDFLNLIRNFTRFSLEEFLCMRTLYGQHLFRLLQSWSDKNELVANLEDLHEILNCAESYQKTFKLFKAKVLNPAVADINDHTSMHVDYDLIRKNRKVIKIKFLFSQRNKTKEVGPRADTQDTDVVSFLLQFDINRKQAEIIQQELGDSKDGLDWLKMQLPLLERRYQKIEDPQASKAGYIYKSLLNEIRATKEKQKKLQQSEEKVNTIRNDIKNDNVVPKKKHGPNQRIANSLNVYMKNKLLTEKEALVIKTYIDDEEFLDIFEENDKKYGHLESNAVYKIMCETLLATVYGKVHDA